MVTTVPTKLLRLDREVVEHMFGPLGEVVWHTHHTHTDTDM